MEAIPLYQDASIPDGLSTLMALLSRYLKRLRKAKHFGSVQGIIGCPQKVCVIIFHSPRVPMSTDCIVFRIHGKFV